MGCSVCASVVKQAAIVAPACNLQAIRAGCPVATGTHDDASMLSHLFTRGDMQSHVLMSERLRGLFLLLFADVRSIAGEGKGINSSDKWIKSRAQRASINTPIQGSAADVASAAMLAIVQDKWLRDNGWKLLLQVRLQAVSVISVCWQIAASVAVLEAGMDLTCMVGLALAAIPKHGVMYVCCCCLLYPAGPR